LPRRVYFPHSIDAAAGPTPFILSLYFASRLAADFGRRADVYHFCDAPNN